MNINPNMMNMLKMFLNRGGTPDTLLFNTPFNHPMIKNLIGMAKSGNINNIETFAKNICKEKGIDYDTEFPKFMENFKR